MTKIYAGILGSLAFAITMVRGVAHGMAVEPTLWRAVGCVAMFAGIGLVLGWIAERTVVESVLRKAAESEPPVGGAQANSGRG